MIRIWSVYLFSICALFGIPAIASAQAPGALEQGFVRAEVIYISDERETIIPGTDTKTHIQTVQAKILDSDRAGEVVVFENDFVMMRTGQTFFLDYMHTPNGETIYSVRDLDRRAPIVGLLLFFVAIVLWFGGKQGARSLLSLTGSLLVILYVLLPLLLHGFNPVLVSIVIGAVILFVAIFFTHGFSMQSTVAFGGTVIAVMLTGILSTIAIRMLHLSGFFSHETTYLNFSTNGALDVQGLLLGAIIIGVLGVLDDIAITQVAVVSELKHSIPDITRPALYTKALRVGREHVSALVNTIVLAYTGVSLPLLLWFYGSTASFDMIINSEVFATEIARTIIGSIGLILTVPITTALAVFFVDRFKRLEHTHAHGHTHAHRG
jgi:uncharacterized membrane protein